MREINTLEDLKAEQKRLRLQQAYLEGEIKTGLAELKKDLEPLRALTKGAGSVLSSKHNGILGNSLGSVAEYLSKNVFLRNSGFLTRLIVPFLTKNATSNVVENHKPEIVEWIKNLMARFSKKKTVEE